MMRRWYGPLWQEDTADPSSPDACDWCGEPAVVRWSALAPDREDGHLDETCACDRHLDRLRERWVPRRP